MRERTYHYLEREEAFTAPKRFLSAAVAMVPTGRKFAGGFRNELVCAAWEIREEERKGDAYHLARVRKGTQPEAFRFSLKKLLEKGRSVDLWTINAVATLGAIGFWEGVENGQWILQSENWQGQVIISDPPTIVVTRPGKGCGVVRILDLKNIGIESIDELREVTEWEDYCRADWWSAGFDADVAANSQATAISEYLERWFETLKDHELGEMKPTISSQAMTAFRHRFLDTAILVHANQKALALEKAALYPGRAECFFIGKYFGTSIHLDFSSYYPSICRDLKIPVRLRKYGEHADGSFLVDNDSFGIADVTLVGASNAYPKRRREDKSIIWPTGTFRTTLAGAELDLAFEMEEVVEVHAYAIYDAEPAFKRFCNWAIQARIDYKRREDRIGEKVIKLFSNSLWGMFAKRQFNWRNNAEMKPFTPWADWYEHNRESGCLDHLRTVGWLGQMLVDSGYGHDSIPQITAAVNAAGRMKLLQAMRTMTDGRLFYVSTDSLIVDLVGYVELQKAGMIGEGEPGKLKVIATENYLDVRGIHDYTLGEASKVSGRPAEAQPGEGGSWKWESFENPSGALKRGERPGPYLVHRSRSPSEVYRHGIVDSSGNVSPIHLTGGD